jgi:hypothetical protein
VSDLHCPATLLVTRAADPDVLAGALRLRNIARVYCSPGTRGPATALARTLGVDMVLDDNLGQPGDGRLADVVDAGREALQEIADLHRGEAVVVLLGPSTPVTEVLQVSVDGDGFVVTSWPGVADRSVG